MDISSIEKTARLANLHISDEEKKQYAEQITEILGYVEKINSLDTAGIEPADHIAELTNVLRPDKTVPSMETSKLEAIAPQFHNGHIVVPKIIDGEA